MFNEYFIKPIEITFTDAGEFFLRIMNNPIIDKIFGYIVILGLFYFGIHCLIALIKTILGVW